MLIEMMGIKVFYLVFWFFYGILFFKGFIVIIKKDFKLEVWVSIYVCR